MKSRYDVMIVGAGHNGLVAAAYLVRAGLSVLVLERNDYLGGAATSQQVFSGMNVSLSRYAYLVSLLPEKIIRDLGLELELRTRATASFTPYVRDGKHHGLILSNRSEEVGRASVVERTGSAVEFEQLGRFYRLARVFAEAVWETMLEPLVSREELRRRFEVDELHREAWRSLVEEPLGCAIERYLQDDLLRGVVFTDGKIGLLTQPHDPSLLQNRCFLYHLIGNKTGDWKVPVGGMGRVSGELARVAKEYGAQMVTGARVTGLEVGGARPAVEFEKEGATHRVAGRFLLMNTGRDVLARLTGGEPVLDGEDEGSVFKINMLLERLPRLKAGTFAPAEAFCGTFHVDEGYEEMNASYRQAARGELPDRVPCEVYCHTLTDPSLLSAELRAKGFHTLTLFGLDTPWRCFAGRNEAMRARAAERFVSGLNAWLSEPIEGCLARDREGRPCLEAKSPVDIEEALGHYRGNIFHRALQFPFAERAEEAGQWGVETEYENVLICGSSARRGGAVSGIPGHNAAMKVLEAEG